MIVEDLLTDPLPRRRAASLARQMTTSDGATTALRQIIALATARAARPPRCGA